MSRFVFTEVLAPELFAKIKAPQDGGHLDLVPTGPDTLSAGLDQGIWLDLAPYAADVSLPQALKMQAIAQGYALFPHMSARRNVGFGVAMLNVSRRRAPHRRGAGAGRSNGGDAGRPDPPSRHARIDATSPTGASA